MVRMKTSLLLVSLASLTLWATPETPYARNLALGMKTPETSSLFVKHVDPQTGIVSYLIKPGLLAFNQQSIYFTAQSMTDDGRFLVFDVAPDEFAVPNTSTRTRKKAIVDFLKDEAIVLEGIGGVIPYLDVKRDQLWWVDKDGVHRRDFLEDPRKDNVVWPLPPELVWKDDDTRYGTHITLTPDHKRIFIDARTGPTEKEGCLNLENGKWEEWGRARFCCNHGQINPVDDTLALCAMEFGWNLTFDEVTPEDLKQGQAAPFASLVRRPHDHIYPRLWLFRNGEHWMVRSKITNGATHENFAADGKGFYWCTGGVCYHDLATGREWRINPCGSAHSFMTADNKYITFDCHWGKWWRGCGWTIGFWNRDTHRAVYIHSHNPIIAQQDNQSRLHPDPHPQFVCNDRYVVCTMGDDQRRLNVSVTPVADLIARTSDPATAPVPHRFEVASWKPDLPGDAPFELEIDVKALRDRKLVAEPGCAVYMDSYTPFALEAEVDGKMVSVPFEAVQSPAYADRVILRFEKPQGATKLFYVADAPGRFEYYDSESCANLFTRATPHDLFPPKSVQIAKPGEDTAAAACDIPVTAAGRPVKFEIKLRNFAKANWTGNIRLICQDKSGRKIGDILNGHIDGKTFTSGKRREFNEICTLPKNAAKVCLVIDGTNADGSKPQMELQHLNLRVARVLPFTPPAN